MKIFKKIEKSDDVGKTIKKYYEKVAFDLNAQDEYKNTPLHYFVDHETMIYNHHYARKNCENYDLSSFKDTIAFFFEKKSDFTITNNTGHAALHKALEILPASKDMVRVLLDHKSDPNQEYRGSSPLYLLLNTSIYFYLPNIVDGVKLLLEYKADPHWQTKDGIKVFHLALSKPQYHRDFVVPFLESGVNPCEYYDYEHLPYQAINPNNGEENRSLYITCLSAIPAWMKQKYKKNIETFLCCMKAVKAKNGVFAAPPRALCNYLIFNFIVPRYNNIKEIIHHIRKKDGVLSKEEQEDIDKNIKEFITLYS